ncbi:UPF0193 protein EVG1 homolog [Anthonomus grandis grandis]|uniref:UPF0193 protein EVG1 homolog n=1 Tax=Anthonomus grandis grandis TaxID=2921223 RepID=UPI002166AD18|nr:UPF0193 protein EVG1 homolog [Anthonomus grandis grandis]
MEWPSKNIPQGGILHPAKASYSPETHQFLKVLMDESKLSMMQRKQINYILRNGEPLPVPGARPKKNTKIPKVTIRPGSSRRRSKEDIVNSGAYERETYRSNVPLMDREREKDKLANKMAYNDDVKVSKSRILKKVEKEEVALEPNRFDQLVEEIREREEWIKEMEKLGQADKYRLIIEQQIQDKVREMQRLQISQDL